MKPLRIYHWFVLSFLIVMAAAWNPLFAKIPDTWDGLVRVEAKKMSAVYLMPDADFRGYSKVMIDRPEVAFQKNWQRDYNRDSRSVGNRVSDTDMRRAIDGGTAKFAELLGEAYAKEGYQVVQEPGLDVLRVSTAIINVRVAAPDVMTSARSRTYTSETGEGTLVIEVRDSVSGSLLGRALDRRVAGDNSYMDISNSVTNRSDFERLFSQWARMSATGLTKLKGMSPGGAAGQRQ